MTGNHSSGKAGRCGLECDRSALNSSWWRNDLITLADEADDSTIDSYGTPNKHRAARNFRRLKPHLIRVGQAIRFVPEMSLNVKMPAPETGSSTPVEEAPPVS